MPDVETWEIWYPEAAANGLLVARCRIDATDVLWVHAAPAVIAVAVRDATDTQVARGESLKRAGPQTPMTRLTRSGATVMREDRWPTADDLGATVVVPGGEAGVLMAWWNAEDESEWRWSAEFYNRR